MLLQGRGYGLMQRRYLSLDEPSYIVDVYYQVVQTLATTQRSNPRPCWATSLRTSWATCYSAQGIPQGIPLGIPQ